MMNGLSDAQVPRRRSTARLHAIDTAKGVGIILVVFGHAWRGAFGAGILRDAELFRVIDSMIYAWHMPLFFFLSGLLFLDVLERVPTRLLVISRARQLLWPLALWTWIFFGVKLLAGQSANTPVTMADFPLIPLPPYEHLWFLWALLLAQLVVMALFRILRPVMAPATMRRVLGGVAVALTLLIPLVYLPSPYFGAAVEHFPYFIAGMALGGIAHLRPPVWMALGAALLFALLLYATVVGWSSLLVSLSLTVLACVVIARLDPGTEDPPAVVRWLRYLGLYSLAIFLAHTIFSAAFRIGMLKAGVENLPVHLVVAVIVGLAGPVLLVWASRRLGIAKVLGF